jgi:hypothetical protein
MFEVKNIHTHSKASYFSVSSVDIFVQIILHSLSKESGLIYVYITF